ncbi:MAG: type II secretion system F family protein [Candidatus Anstonellales archaeon]
MDRKRKLKEEDPTDENSTKSISIPASLSNLLSYTLKYFPNLQSELVMANLTNYTTLSFAYHALRSSLFLSLSLLLIAYLFLPRINPVFFLFLFPLFLLFSFFYFMNFPRVKANVRARLIESELVFAGRHILISLRAGVPLYDAISAASSGYGEASKEFNRIIEKTALGMPVNAAMHEVAATNPSQMFRRVVLQLSNALSSGSDVANSLDSVLEQISREQLVSLKAYGQKLYPLVMFFMVFGIVFPSLGVALGSILLSFIGFWANANGSLLLLVIFVIISLFQFLFVSAIEASRPRVGVG